MKAVLFEGREGSRTHVRRVAEAREAGGERRQLWWQRRRPPCLDLAGAERGTEMGKRRLGFRRGQRLGSLDGPHASLTVGWKRPHGVVAAC